MRPLGDRICSRCGKDYWANQAWLHETCKVVHSAVVVHKEERIGSSRHGKYADAEKRKTYRREWMRKRRAS